MNRPGKRVSTENGKPTLSGENYNKIHVDKAEKNNQLTVDETLFFDSLSARFKPWYHSWPYVPESTTINPCLKILIFYRTSPELPTFLVVSNLKGRRSFPPHI